MVLLTVNLVACTAVDNVVLLGLDNDESNMFDEWVVFEDEEIGISFQYPLGLLFEISDEGDWDVGEMKSIKFSGEYESVEIAFTITATTENYGAWMSEGCCKYFSGEFVDTDNSLEILWSVLEGDVKCGKLFRIYNLEKVSLGSHEMLRFAKLFHHIESYFTDVFLLPNPNSIYTNIMISWRGGGSFFSPSYPSEEKQFEEMEVFVEEWMTELDGNDLMEKKIVEDILSTLKFIK